MKTKQTPPFVPRVRKIKNTITTKTKIEWAILIALVLLIPIGLWSNLFAYQYYYFKCEGQPLELDGAYYRVSGDKGYGIHPGSDYSKCMYDQPQGVQRDPSTKVGAAMVQRQIDEANRQRRMVAAYDIHAPKGYTITDIVTSERGDGLETQFSVTTKTDHIFRVREMKHDNDFSYTNLCTKPAEGSWSGTIIGQDDKGRDICRTDINQYVDDYIVGMNIGKTAIMLQAPIDSAPEELLNAEAAAIFSAMESYSDK